MSHSLSLTLRLTELVSEHVGAVGGVIAALRAIQEEFAHIPDEADLLIADLFNLSRAEVRGIISFYADFSRTRKEGLTVRLCAAEACQAAGVQTIRKELEDTFDGGSTAMRVTIEDVYCLGLCSVAPAALVDGRLVGRANAERIRVQCRAAGVEVAE